MCYPESQHTEYFPLSNTTLCQFYIWSVITEMSHYIVFLFLLSGTIDVTKDLLAQDIRGCLQFLRKLQFRVLLSKNMFHNNVLSLVTKLCSSDKSLANSILIEIFNLDIV